MSESDLAEARTIVSLAFGTFLGVPNPETLWPDRDYVFTRWRTNPGGALAAEVNRRLAGSNFVTNWGSFGFFGPLTVRPEMWDQHIGQALLAPTMDLFEKWGVRDTGLFTFAHSTKHVGLYQKFGFYPRFLTAVMSKTVRGREASFIKYSTLNENTRDEAVRAARQLADSIYEGLDVTCEIRSVSEQGLGETVLLWDGDSLEAFAVCHCGEGTEAGANNCYVKFAAVRSAPNAERTFDRLLEACETLAAEKGLTRMECGMNLARSHAYRRMLHHGYRTNMQGVAMHRDDREIWNRPDVYVIDDWR
jgi:GNAT superfamily N-acetyltransferase